MVRLRITFLATAFAMLCAAQVGAEGIDFEDVGAANDSQLLIRDDYAHLGVEFVPSDDGATWDGVGAGDPGDWQVAGTNGSTFLGFDGQSYAMSMRFDEPVESFQLDATRAAGVRLFFLDMFQVTGFLDGSIVETRAVYFGGVNDWKTVTLGGMVDKVVFFGNGLRGHRFAVDNLQWVSQQPQTMQVEIDIRPGSDKNPIQLRSRGVAPVVLYAEDDFAVEEIDVATLEFGPDGAGVAHRNGPHFDDVDGDGLVDMIVHHRIADMGLVQDDVDACLSGQTLDGMDFEGCDTVEPIGR